VPENGVSTRRRRRRARPSHGSGEGTNGLETGARLPRRRQPGEGAPVAHSPGGDRR
jgi:hypothetical protein